MTRDEAEAFLERNPKIAERIDNYKQAVATGKLDALWPIGAGAGGATNEADACINLVEVVRALDLDRNRT